MQNISFKLIVDNEILTIVPILQELNTTTPKEILEERVLDMVGLNYECVGVYDGDKLIGISGLWFSTRHYCGKSVEPDHVVITKAYQGKGIGKLLFDWIYDYAKHKGCTTTELNAYTENRASHKFYYNEGFEILGFHFLKRFK
jgi:GNAT superfamily N-acetyltransferase